MKRFLMALALTSWLAGSAIAGDVSTSGSPAPAPSGTTQTAPSTLAGDVPSVPGDIPCGGSQHLSSDVLSALLSVLGFLVV
jgi:hypothetical protein